MPTSENICRPTMIMLIRAMMPKCSGTSTIARMMLLTKASICVSVTPPAVHMPPRIAFCLRLDGAAAGASAPADGSAAACVTAS